MSLVGPRWVVKNVPEGPAQQQMDEHRIWNGSRLSRADPMVHHQPKY